MYRTDRKTLLKAALIILGVGATTLGVIIDLVRGQPIISIGYLQGSIIALGIAMIAMGAAYDLGIKLVRSWTLGARNFIAGDYRDISQSWVLLFFIVLAIIFYFDKLILGPEAQIRVHDTFDVDFPRLLVEGNLLLEHGFFGWYPNLGGGSPAYAYHYTPYHPLALLATAIPSWLIYSALVIGFMFLAGLGMYLFLYRVMAMPHWVGLFGGALFAVNSQIQGNGIVHNTFLFLYPLFFVATSGKLFAQQSRVSVIVSIAVVICILLLSFVSLTLVIFSFAHLLTLYIIGGDTWKYYWKTTIGICLIWGGYALLNLPLIYGLLEFQQHYHRDYELFVKVFPPLEYWEEFIIYFSRIVARAGGLPLIFLAILVARNSQNLRRVMVVSLIVLFGASIFAADTREYFRLLDNLDLVHLIWLAPFFVSVTLALIVYECCERELPKKVIVFVALVIVIFFIVGNYNQISVFQNSQIMFLNVCVSFAVVGILLFSAGQSEKRNVSVVRAFTRNLFIVCIFMTVISAIGGFRMERSNKEYHDYSPLYDQTEISAYIQSKGNPYRLGAVEPVDPSLFYINQGEAVDAKSPVFFKRYKDVFELVIEKQFENEDERNYFRAYFYELYLGSSVDKLNTNLLRMLNMKYLVTQVEISDSVSWSLVKVIDLDRPLNRYAKNSTKLYLYKLAGVFQRAYLVPHVVIEKSDEAVLDRLARATHEDLLSNVYVVETSEIDKIQYPKTSLVDKGTTIGQVTIVSYKPDEIVLSVDTIRSGFLVISNNYHPKWEAFIDGKQVDIVRANHAFQAVSLSGLGGHEVIFRYRDPILWWSHLGFLVGLLLVVFGVVWQINVFQSKAEFRG